MTEPGADSIPAIAESDATGDVAALYQDLRVTLGVPFVNLIWRHLATIPGGLAWVWTLTKPLYVSGELDRLSTEASARLQSVLLGLFPREEAERHASRCVAVAGDLTRHRLGISQEHAELIAEEVSEVVHSAASVSFT